MSNIFTKILNLKEFKDKPPVFIDIGASGDLNPEWKLISKHSICIAFDADNRDVEYLEKENSNFKKLYVFNCIVSDKNSESMSFYLTKSPHCSSSLEPLNEDLKIWDFSSLFETKEIIKVKAKSLKSVLSDLGLDYVDWFKTDSQGTDLRLFDNLGDVIKNNVLISEFEPGILPAYKGEDKLFQLVNYMENLDFWMNDLEIRGPRRLNSNIENKLSISEKNILSSRLIKSSPGWAYVSYLNNLSNDFITKREYLLTWIFSMIKKEYAFCLELSLFGKSKFDDNIFDDLFLYTKKEINNLKPKYKILSLKLFYEKVIRYSKAYYKRYLN